MCRRRTRSITKNRKLEETTKAVNNVLEGLKKALKIVEEMQIRVVQVNDDNLGPTLKMELGNKAKSCGFKRLEDICDKMKEAEEAESSTAERLIQEAESSTAKSLIQEAWEQYTDEVYKESQPVFEEYVEFLGELCLYVTQMLIWEFARKLMS